jgi:3-oxoadipate enol-lactonase
MLYGLGGTSNSFQAMVSALASFRLVRPDLPGASRSSLQAEKADHRLIDCPALIVTGDEHAVGPPSIAQELADKIRGAKTVILNRCGHWTPVEKSKECGKLLSEFVRGIPI